MQCRLKGNSLYITLRVGFGLKICWTKVLEGSNPTPGNVYSDSHCRYNYYPIKRVYSVSLKCFLVVLFHVSGILEQGYLLKYKQAAVSMLRLHKVWLNWFVSRALLEYENVHKRAAAHSYKFNPNSFTLWLLFIHHLRAMMRSNNSCFICCCL